MTGFSDAALNARLDALDAAVPVVEALPGDQSSLISNIAAARTMVVELRNVRAAHSVFRDIKSALDHAGVSNPTLATKMDQARTFD